MEWENACHFLIPEFCALSFVFYDIGPNSQPLCLKMAHFDWKLAIFCHTSHTALTKTCTLVFTCFQRCKQTYMASLRHFRTCLIALSLSVGNFQVIARSDERKNMANFTILLWGVDQGAVSLGYLRSGLNRSSTPDFGSAAPAFFLIFRPRARSAALRSGALPTPQLATSRPVGPWVPAKVNPRAEKS